MENWLNLNEQLGRQHWSSQCCRLYIKRNYKQLGRDGVILKEYTLVNCMPTVVSPVELSMDTASAIEEFSVTWRYTHFQSKK